MTYVAPNSKLQLFKGINLDNRYLHTIYFANESAQNTWFTSKVTSALSFNNLSYRRYGSNAVKIEIDATSLLGVTYMRFQNDRTVDKWFYAFVLGTDYINENTSIVYYEIDVMQTWFIQNGSVRPCMVLREHVTGVHGDDFGANLEEEPIGSNVYDCDSLYSFDEFGSYSIVAQTTGISNTGDRFTQGLFNGSKIKIYPCNNSGQADAIYGSIQSLLGSWSIQEQEEDVVNLYTVPSWLIEYGEDYSVDYSAINELSTDDDIQRPTTYDNYTPKNNKLFMYPYSYLLCTTHTGDVAMYRWEYFDGQTAEFRCTGTYLGGGEIWCYPLAYNGKTNDIDSGLIMNNFPKNAFAYDAYQAWIASGGSTRLENERVVASFHGVGGVLQSIAGLAGAISSPVSTRISDENMSYAGYVGATPIASQSQRTLVSQQYSGKSAGGLLGAVGSTTNQVGNLIEAKNNLQYEFNNAVYHPNIVATKPTCNLAVASREANFYFYHCHVRDDEAKRIDDFFSCYGYAINRVKTPNLTGRAYWNFVMTKDAVIAGNMPSSSKEAIGRIFDTGITFWHNGDNVGNYRVGTASSTDSVNNPIS